MAWRKYCFDPQRNGTARDLGWKSSRESQDLAKACSPHGHAPAAHGRRRDAGRGHGTRHDRSIRWEPGDLDPIHHRIEWELLAHAARSRRDTHFGAADRLCDRQCQFRLGGAAGGGDHNRVRRCAREGELSSRRRQLLGEPLLGGWRRGTRRKRSSQPRPGWSTGLSGAVAARRRVVRRLVDRSGRSRSAKALRFELNGSALRSGPMVFVPAPPRRKIRLTETTRWSGAGKSPPKSDAADLWYAAAAR